MIMIKKVDKDTTKKYPYLAKDKTGRLLLVGRHSAVMIEPEEDGNGYNDSAAIESTNFTRLPYGESYLLIQD